MTTIGTDMARRLVYPRWKRGARVRVVKRYASKFIASFKEGLGSVWAVVFAFRSPPDRRPRLAIDMAPMDKLVFASLSTPMTKKKRKK